jgi:hypothetical protein
MHQTVLSITANTMHALNFDEDVYGITAITAMICSVSANGTTTIVIGLQAM